MKSYLIQGIKKIETVEHNPPVIKEDEVLIKVSHLGICGSDVQLYQGTYNGPFSYPIMFGHEWSGIVKQTGVKVKALKPGDKVTGDCSRYCGECENCQIDKNVCRFIEKYGITIDGASSEYIVRSEKYIYKAPQDLDFDLLCLTEPLAVSAHLIDKISARVGDISKKNILVLGSGSIGLGALMILMYHYRCKYVDVFDIEEKRRSLAKKIGGSLPSEDDMTGSRNNTDYNSIYTSNKYDIIIEATGNPEAFANTFNLIRPLGIIGCLGMISDVTIKQKIIIVKALDVLGSIGGTGHFPFAINFINKHRKLVREMVSHVLSINDFERAFELSTDNDKAMKIELRLYNE